MVRLQHSARWATPQLTWLSSASGCLFAADIELNRCEREARLEAKSAAPGRPIPTRRPSDPQPPTHRTLTLRPAAADPPTYTDPQTRADPLLRPADPLLRPSDPPAVRWVMGAARVLSATRPEKRELCRKGSLSGQLEPARPLDYVTAGNALTPAEWRAPATPQRTARNFYRFFKEKKSFIQEFLNTILEQHHNQTNTDLGTQLFDISSSVIT